MFSHYPSTQQFRHTISCVKKWAKNHDQESPTLIFIGTVKLHGCNAAIGYQKDTGHWCQSRNNIITSEKDFEACAKSLSPVADQLLTELILPQCPAIREHYEMGRKIIIFGERCGGQIQKNVAIHGLPKMFVIFNVQIREMDDTLTEMEEENDNDDDQSEPKSTFWLQPTQWSHIKWHKKSIYNIYDFQTFELDIDFKCPQLAQNKLIEITDTVENQCPVGTYFKRQGIGEGVVWSEWEKSSGIFRFKVKGPKHSTTNVVTLAAVDTEKCENIQNFVNYACTENRMCQGLDYLREQQLTIEMKNFGIFIKWLIGDIVKEENDTMDAANFSRTDVGRTARVKALSWYQKQLVET